MEIETVEKTSFWTKKQNDLTVGDQLKVIGAASVIGIVAPVAIGAVTYGAIVLWEKVTDRKKNKKLEVVKTEK